MTGDVLSALTAALAVSVELLEALAIVLAVGISRRWSDALIGAAAAVVVCGIAAALLGGGALQAIPIDSLRFVIGALLLLFGLEWLRKGTLRLAGVRARSSAQDEYDETVEALADDPLPPEGQADWAGRAIAFKGVLLEGIEIVLIVSVIASRPGGAAPALIGAGLAIVVTIVFGIAMRRHLAGLPETEVKFGVGILLASFGVFFCGEGLGVDWAGGEVALLYIAAAIGLAAWVQVEMISRRVRPA